MAKPEWGLKRNCLSCGAKFYDLQRDPVDCPSCGTRFDPESAIKLKRGRTMVADTAKPKKEAEGGDVELLGSDDESLDDGGDDSVLEDTSDLDDNESVTVVSPSGEDDGDDS